LGWRGCGPLAQGYILITAEVLAASSIPSATAAGPIPAGTPQAIPRSHRALRSRSVGLGLRGCSKTATGRESGFAETLWLARDALERDAVDIAVVGAVESLASDFVLRDWAPDEPLPSDGPAEGAVVFAIRRWAAAGPRAFASLRDLRFSPPTSAESATEAAETDWVPTLSAATRLLAALSQPGTGMSVQLGGGFSITVDTHEKGEKHDRAHANLPVFPRGR